MGREGDGGTGVATALRQTRNGFHSLVARFPLAVGTTGRVAGKRGNGLTEDLGNNASEYPHLLQSKSGVEFAQRAMCCGG